MSDEANRLQPALKALADEMALGRIGFYEAFSRVFDMGLREGRRIALASPSPGTGGGATSPGWIDIKGGWVCTQEPHFGRDVLAVKALPIEDTGDMSEGGAGACVDCWKAGLRKPPSEQVVARAPVVPAAEPGKPATRLRECTCVARCLGTEGLAVGWRCGMTGAPGTCRATPEKGGTR